MSVYVAKNTSDADEPLAPPARPDGSAWPFAMYFNGGYDVAFADTYTELLDVLSPGYAALNDEVDVLTARIRLGVTAAVWAQTMILAEADGEAVSESDYATLVAPKAGPAVRADWWSCPIPLVVVDGLYQPHTDVPRPASALGDYKQTENLWWIRPQEEEDFLFSLHEVGYIRLMAASD